jgi:ribonuclease HII
VLSRAEKTAALDQLLYGFIEELDGGNNLTIIGIDEVGRGSLSGPLTVAAVCLPLAPRVSGLNDSKKLSATRREKLATQLYRVVVCYSIQDICADEIDSVGMAEALRRGMRQALREVAEAAGEPDAVLIDGTPLHIHAREQAIVKGDGKVASIAAASIIAKVHRDALMVAYSQEYPHYGWESNKGYGSAAHIAAIRERGLTPLHRRGFCRGILQEGLF